ncbi:hypothetical protein JCM24511_03828 [Saitozyma sp. JCM 24511]|nr:hypothetical protein JCM24511_03828 [Saitozyma sp. JCM 24511]
MLGYISASAAATIGYGLRGIRVEWVIKSNDSSKGVGVGVTITITITVMVANIIASNAGAPRGRGTRKAVTSAVQGAANWGWEAAQR